MGGSSSAKFEGPLPLPDSRDIDVLVVGAGPAGLAAGQAARAAGARTVVVEAGPALRSRNRIDPALQTTGVGGAGLFSDGKFSFFPSATQLWRLDSAALKSAFNWFSHLLHEHDLDAGHLPDLNLNEPQELIADKRYLSVYMTLAKRRQLIRDLALALDSSLWVGSEIVGSVAAEASRYRVLVHRPRRPVELLRAQALILCTGRLGALRVPTVHPYLQTSFRRVEYGVRVQQQSRDFFLRTHAQVDPKLAGRAANGEWRTFCCCRNGEVVTTRSQGLTLVSGRSDGRRTGKSNVGINVRLTDSTLATEELDNLLKRMALITEPILESGSRFRSADSDMRELLGQVASSVLDEAFGVLGVDLERATPIGPTVEGIGSYPITDDVLRSGYHKVWIAGDLTGRFRGLTAALVSGYLAGEVASKVVNAGE